MKTHRYSTPFKRSIFALFSAATLGACGAEALDAEPTIGGSTRGNAAEIRLQYGRYYSFVPSHATERFVQHRDGLGFALPLDEALAASSSTFRLVEGLGDPTGVSFESANEPGAFLRLTDGPNRNGTNRRVVLSSELGSNVAQEEATFYRQDGLTGSGHSFESMAQPGHFFRTNDFFEVWASVNDGRPDFEADATFIPARPLTEPNRALNGRRVAIPGEGRVDLVERGLRRPMTESVASRLFTFAATTTSDARFERLPVGSALSDAAFLGRVPGTADVYLIDGGVRRLIPGDRVFARFGFEPGAIRDTAAEALAALREGPTLE